MSQLTSMLVEHPENSTTVRSGNEAPLGPPPEGPRPEKKRPAPAALRAAGAAVRLVGSASPELGAAIAEKMFRTPRRHPRPAAEHEVLERGRRLEVPFGERRLAAWEWGEAGPRVLLVHGWEGRAAQLGSMIEPLVELGFRVVGFDAPAHGDSPGTMTSFVEFAESIGAVADALGPFHAIVSHSMGGAAMTWALRSRPLAKRYAMISPPAALSDFVAGFSSALELSDEVRAHLEARLDRVLGVPLRSVRAEEVVRDQRAPLLVVHDLGDREVPFEKGRSIAEAWPGAVLHRTDGLGHRRILRDPEVVALVRRFVAWGATS